MEEESIEEWTEREGGRRGFRDGNRKGGEGRGKRNEVHVYDDTYRAAINT